MTTTMFLIGSISFLFCLNVYASYKCLSSDFSDTTQKVVQCILLWTIPLLGPLLVIYFAKAMDTGPDYKTSDATHYIDSSATHGGSNGSS